MPIIINDDETLVFEQITTDELIEFIIKQTVFRQQVIEKCNDAMTKADELTRQVGLAKMKIDQAYRKLHEHLNDRATRQRHTE